MKFYFFILLLICHFLVAAEEERTLVNASDYCLFLNGSATMSADNFYNFKMASDVQRASILQLGTPGKFHYQLIEGRENMPVAYVSRIAQEAYRDWLKNKEEVKEVFQSDDGIQNSEFSLASNEVPFYCEVKNNELSLPIDSTLKGDKSWLSNTEKYLLLIAFSIALDEAHGSQFFSKQIIRDHGKEHMVKEDNILENKFQQDIYEKEDIEKIILNSDDPWLRDNQSYVSTLLSKALNKLD